MVEIDTASEIADRLDSDCADRLVKLDFGRVVEPVTVTES